MSTPYDPYNPSGEQPNGGQPYGGQPGGQQPDGGQQPPYGTPPAYGSTPSYPSTPYGAQAPGYPTAPPPAGGAGYGAPPPPNYLVWAILTTVLCCLPLGVPSIVFAAQVNSKWYAGDAAGAYDASRKAKQFAIWSAVAGAVGILAYVALVVGGILSSDSSSM
ncbi:CD225/dispanin family protein [Cellulomonas persica]|uniref:Interferon-induced transmembrane protein n=1 Tax=Cellulomonas persica TaxID=76861 RepID=A0A510UX29_9CELL|nr:CD225/dispanin family protein [Cellulomonas persica]GEK19208.1 hypothetical protein CPE01_29410 [Cellulomonas persica]